MIDAVKAYTDSFLNKESFYDKFSSVIEKMILSSSKTGRLYTVIHFNGQQDTDLDLYEIKNNELYINTSSWGYNFKTLEEELKNKGYKVFSVLTEQNTDIDRIFISWDIESFQNERIKFPEFTKTLNSLIRGIN